MKTKQQVIEEAYGEHWDDVKLDADHNGWIYINRPINHAYPQVGISPEDVGFDYLSVEKRWATGSSDGYYWRPLALKGLEDNNGWHVINSEADLPKEAGYYYCWFRDMERKERAFFDPQNRYCIDFCLVWYSHWQPELQPPLYGPDQKGGSQ